MFPLVCSSLNVRCGFLSYTSYTAVDTAVEWALRQPGVCRVEAETDPENQKSQRVLEKCGFVPSGTIGEEGPRFYKEKDYL